jgi:hypothetical protein
MALWTYSPTSVDVLIAGFYKIEGFADGTFVNIQKSNPIYSNRKSADGVVSRSFQKDQLFKIDITLSQSAPSNSILMKLIEIDELTQMGMFPLTIKDNSGSTFFHSSNTWITTLPNVTFSSGIETRTWELLASEGVMNIGDNSGQPDVLEELINQVTAFAPTIGNLIR